MSSLFGNSALPKVKITGTNHDNLKHDVWQCYSVGMEDGECLGVAAKCSTTIDESITAAIQPVLDLLGCLVASSAITVTGDAAVSVLVQYPAHG